MQQKHKIIAISILAGLGFWVLDALGDKYFKFQDEPFLSILLYDAPSHEFFIRPLMLAFFFAFGLVINNYVFRVRESEGRYRQLFDNIDDIVFVRCFKNENLSGKFLEVNPAAYKKLGYTREEFLQMSPRDLSLPEDLPQNTAFIARLKEKGRSIYERTVVTKSGGRLPVEINAHVANFMGRPVVLSIVRDITERKEKEREIVRLASYPQLAPNPILEVDLNGRVTFYNPATAKILAGMGSQDTRLFLPPDFEDILKAAQETGETQFQREVEVNGKVFSEHIHFVPQFETLRFYPINVTERRRWEEALRESEQRLRILTSQLLNVQEDERRRISIELHDELGQALMFLKLQLAALQDRLRKDQKRLRQEADYLLHYLDGVIENVRRLARNLSPTVLEELGLSSAIRFLLEELGKHSINIDSPADKYDIDHLFSSRAQLNIYRIFQECLTNITRHSEATNVSVLVKKEGEKVHFAVRDNGKGFAPEWLKPRGIGDKGIGMATMAERVQMLGGSLHIQSREGQGTEVSFTIPVELEKR